MDRQLKGTALAIIFALVAQAAPAQGPSPTPVAVTPDNFVRAETDRYFAGSVQRAGRGRLEHHRTPMPIDAQTVIRANRDTLYSSGVFDLEAGPVTITLPDPGNRFLSMQVISEDHYTPAVHYGAGRHIVAREWVGTRYALVGVRILIDPSDPEDARRVHALQDAIAVAQAGPGRFEAPDWDQERLAKVRTLLLGLAETLPDTRRMFGTRDRVDPVRHLIGTASAWGGNPETEALYLNVVPGRNDGDTLYRLDVGQVPVDGFWSVSVYNAEGYFQANPLHAYSLNSLTAQQAGNEAVRVQFGGCDGRVPNCLPIMPGWNYMVRLYRPPAEILDGRWRFPEARPAG
ncbi:DUF1254 domain-containing protein [Paracraurococcus lichenis]|uniref:DUF1254 domain-containing protein n=1 Tax=Paracraurococcus lichenis TaxID=3064888 RepID=A0ABT9EDY2_9PROT|nr:DUF1254 domain-containing protein [Paracraurococcus sp. LOR1-02]MDO9714090.1 DUF1254 domain-containing protein [Paracraurococcus sp. LOR1-02]